MPIVLNILQRVIVNHFYKVNTGFFLFVFFTLFGLPHDVTGFHLSIIQGIIESPLLLMIVLCVWLAYNLKCINYVIKQIQEPAQQFLFCLNHLSSVKLYWYMLFVQTMVYLPVLLYSAAIIIIATQQQYYSCMLIVLVFNMVVIFLTAQAYVYAVRKKSVIRLPFQLPQINIGFTKPLFLMAIVYIWHSRKQMLLVTKVFSLLILYAFIKLYGPDHYDIRPLLFCLMLCVVSHSSIVFQIRQFEEDYLSFTRALPVTAGKRFVFMLLQYGLLFLPEFVFIWKGYPLYFSFIDLPQLILFVIGLTGLFHCFLMAENTDMDGYMRIVFGICAVLFFIILFNPGIWLPIILIALSFGMFTAYYFLFEKIN